jgi:predicted DNA-binding protein (MmcQ/YjbR family)
VAKVGKKVFVFFGLTGMDRTHWVWLKPPEDAPLDMLTEWIVESYRAVAPKKLAARLPETAAPP